MHTHVNLMFHTHNRYNTCSLSFGFPHFLSAYWFFSRTQSLPIHFHNPNSSQSIDTRNCFRNISQWYVWMFGDACVT